MFSIEDLGSIFHKSKYTNIDDFFMEIGEVGDMCNNMDKLISTYEKVLTRLANDNDEDSVESRNIVSKAMESLKASREEVEKTIEVFLTL